MGSERRMRVVSGLGRRRSRRGRSGSRVDGICAGICEKTIEGREVRGAHLEAMFVLAAIVGPCRSVLTEKIEAYGVVCGQISLLERILPPSPHDR